MRIFYYHFVLRVIVVLRHATFEGITNSTPDVSNEIISYLVRCNAWHL